MNLDYFLKKFASKSTEELIRYVETPEDFQEVAVEAARIELKNRNVAQEVELQNASNIVTSQNRYSDIRNQASVSGNCHETGLPIKTVSPGLRAAHYVIDGFIIQLIAYLLAFFPVLQLGQLFIFLIYPVYYIFFEYYFLCTPGKYISGTIVVNKDGESPELNSIILRTFSRYVPFEPFSCFGECSYGWHDKWSKTYVIHRKDLTTLREELGLEPLDLKPRRLNNWTLALLGVWIVLSITVGIVINSAFSPSTNKLMSIVESQDKKDRELVVGSWQATNGSFEKINFVTSDLARVIIKGQEAQHVNYQIENRLLTLSGEAFNYEYAIVGFEEDSATLMRLGAFQHIEHWVKKD